MSRKLVGREVRKRIIARRIDKLNKSLKKSNYDGVFFIVYVIIGLLAITLAALLRM